MGQKTIIRLIKTERKPINETVVRTYFELPKRHLKDPNANISQLSRDVKEENNYTGSLKSMWNWLRGLRTPRDVKFALSDGYSVDPSLFDAYPHLKEYLHTYYPSLRRRIT